jgi:hypothetical protein
VSGVRVNSRPDRMGRMCILDRWIASRKGFVVGMEMTKTRKIKSVEELKKTFVISILKSLEPMFAER